MKIRLTEDQYKIFKNILIEAKLHMAAKDIKKGDTLEITSGGKKYSFTVIDSLNGQVFMDYENYRLFFTGNDLDGNSLITKRVEKTNEARMKENPSKWPKFTIKNIDEINIYDKAGNKKEGIDIIKQSNTDDTKKEKVGNKVFDDECISGIIDELSNDLVEGKGVLFTLSDGSNIKFCIESKNGLSYSLEYLEGNDAYDILNKWSIVSLDLNDENIYTKDNCDTFNIKLLLREGNTTDTITLKGVDTFRMVECVDEKDEEEKEEDTTLDDEKENNRLSKELYNHLINDPTLKAAFFKHPSLLNAMLGGDGTGIVKAKEIIGKYNDVKINKRLGTSAKKIKTNNVLEFIIKGSPVRFKDNTGFDVGEKYYGRVKRSNLGDKYYTIKTNDPDCNIHLIKELSEDVFAVKIVRINKNKNFNNQMISDTESKIKILNYNYNH